MSAEKVPSSVSEEEEAVESMRAAPFDEGYQGEAEAGDERLVRIDDEVLSGIDVALADLPSSQCTDSELFPQSSGQLATYGSITGVNEPSDYSEA
ncbi:unnamed protein product, partial [Gongylonema pulchrum]|uniref:CTNNB1_binding domain-containing protein n=1 Tax=Gongylonema pulchrum TaxID=637853 RepID=A0A183DG23_9BILA